MFVTKRGAPFVVSGFAKMIERAGVETKMPYPIHAHRLRHATGFASANKGVDTGTPSNAISATRAFNQRFAVPNWHRTSGDGRG
jgi:site-specific recombinase XerD